MGQTTIPVTLMAYIGNIHLTTSAQRRITKITISAISNSIQIVSETDTLSITPKYNSLPSVYMIFQVKMSDS